MPREVAEYTQGRFAPYMRKILPWEGKGAKRPRLSFQKFAGFDDSIPEDSFNLEMQRIDLNSRTVSGALNPNAGKS